MSAASATLSRSAQLTTWHVQAARLLTPEEIPDVVHALELTYNIRWLENQWDTEVRELYRERAAAYVEAQWQYVPLRNLKCAPRLLRIFVSKVFLAVSMWLCATADALAWFATRKHTQRTVATRGARVQYNGVYASHSLAVCLRVNRSARCA